MAQQTAHLSTQGLDLLGLWLKAVALGGVLGMIGLFTTLQGQLIIHLTLN